MQFNEITSRNNRPQGTHNTTPTNDRLNFNVYCLYCGKKSTKSESATGKNVTTPVNDRKTVEKKRLGKSDQNITPNWTAINLVTLATQRETADTEGKVHMRSAMSQMTNRVRTKAENSARSLSHPTKGPH